MGFESPKFETQPAQPEPEKESRIEKVEEKEGKEPWLFEPKFGEFTFEDRVRAEKRLDNLGEVMEGANFDWWLDGGLNIPIHTGEYHRKHKDIEISVNQDEIEKLHSWAREKGYNIFNTREKKNPQKMSSEDLKTYEINRSLVLSKSEEYDGHTDTEIELHVHETDKIGNQLVEGVTVPKQYFENLPKYETIFGHRVNLSHPLVVAYHKLRIERGDPLEPWEEQYKDIRKSYDVEDLKQLRSKLSDKDIRELEIIIEEQNEKRIDGIDKRLEEIFNILDLNASESEIEQAIRKKVGMSDQSADKRPKISNAIKEISSYIAENKKIITSEDFSEKFKEIIEIEKILGKIKEKFEILKEIETIGGKKESPEKIDNLLSEKEKIRFKNFEKEQEETKKVKEEILEVIKELYNETKKTDNREIIKDKFNDTIIGKYLPVYIEELIDIASKSESENDYIDALRKDGDKYRTEVMKKIEEKFSKP